MGVDRVIAASTFYKGVVIAAVGDACSYDVVAAKATKLGLEACYADDRVAERRAVYSLDV